MRGVTAAVLLVLVGAAPVIAQQHSLERPEGRTDRRPWHDGRRIGRAQAREVSCSGEGRREGVGLKPDASGGPHVPVRASIVSPFIDPSTARR
jgi:hypothetical protein